MKNVFGYELFEKELLLAAVLLLSGCSGIIQRRPTPTPLIERDISPTITLPAAVPDLISVLQNGDSISRIAAARKLGEMGPDASSAVPALMLNLYFDGSYEVREAAVWGLAEIGPRASEAIPVISVVLLTDFVHVRRAAARAIGKIGDTVAMYALVKALDDKDPGVSGEAARSIGILAGQNFLDMNSTGYQLDEQGIPLIVHSAKEWWADEGHNKDWLGF